MKLPSLRTTAFLVCLPLLPGCSDPLGPRDELNEARRRWKALGMSAYGYTHSRSCECLPDYTRPARVHVVAGSVVKAHFIPGGSQVPAAILSTYPTIDELFDMVEQALNSRPKPDRLIVEYHRGMGYPTRFEIDPDLRVGDDERTIHASDLASLSVLAESR